MKQYIYLICCLFMLPVSTVFGQALPTIGVGGGFQIPAKKESLSTAFSTQLHFYYPFLKTENFSLGPAIGGDYASSGKALSFARQGFDVSERLSSTLAESSNSSSGQKNLGWRIGPQADVRVGKFMLSGIFQAGKSSWQQGDYRLQQVVSGAANEPVNKEIYAREEVNSSSWALSPRLRVAYPLSNRIHLWTEASLMTSSVNVKEQSLDFPEGTIIDEKTIGNFIEARSVGRETKENWNTSSVQFGLSFQLGKAKSRTYGDGHETDQNNQLKGRNNNTVRSGRGEEWLSTKLSEGHSDDPGEPAKSNINTSQGSIKNQSRTDDKKSKRNNSKNPPYQGDKTTGNNPLFNKTSRSDETRDEEWFLKAVYPANNARFTQDKNVKELRWTLVGAKMPAPKYIVELVRLDNRHQPVRTYHTTTSALSISTEQLAKAALPEGNYRWKVTETTTGTESGPQFFSVGNCQIDFTIKNDTITCLGYEGENRKYKICFESEYQSTSGNLTYTQPGSGLNVFDQSYNALSYTLVAPNVSLQTQIGSTVSTVQYCVEVTVPPSVTGIGLGLQGDDVDPSPIVCRPGASLALDSLPDCICKECDELTVDIQQMQITPYNGQPNQFEFAGNLVSSHPLYAVEIQVLSFAYSAQPTPCSSGVSALEESGMILRPGTTINSSSALQFMNSTAHPNANGNASKVIKYLSNSAMTGGIPMNVVVGLPGPLAGFDPDCCKMDYEVCFRIVVYYDENACKSCVFTKCFQFDNQ